MGYLISTKAKEYIPALESVGAGISFRTAVGNEPVEDICLSWGHGHRSSDSNVLSAECGFFKDAFWIDKKGVYKDSSLLLDEGLEYISSYSPPVNIIDKVLSSGSPSKYSQPLLDIKWSGPVLMLQIPLDHSILYNAPYSFYQPYYETYMGWVERMCQEHGRNLLLKVHPRQINDIYILGVYAGIALRHGSYLANVDMSVINDCKEVLTWTSSTVVDCLMRNVPFSVHGPSMFERLGTISPEKAANFLLWKYCIPCDISVERLCEILDLYVNSSELYPLPEEYSWGARFQEKFTYESA